MPFKKKINKEKKEETKEKEAVTKEFKPKYNKPKILLIDLPEKALQNVRSAGFNTHSGTFGSPYKVELSSGYKPLIAEPSLPNFTEQEIIIIDLKPPETLNEPEGKKDVPLGVENWWVKCDIGVIDPRPKFMLYVQKHFDRILEHGGLFVIFAKSRLNQDIVWGKSEYGRLSVNKKLKYDNWSFLSILNPENIKVKEDFGEEISLPDYSNDHPLFQFLKQEIKNCEYDAIFRSFRESDFMWLPILESKYGDDVAGVIIPKDSEGNHLKERIIILPQTENKSEVIPTLLKEVLPEISPHLFPHVEGARWVERDEYELESVLNLKGQKVEARKRVEKEIKELDIKIAEERGKFGFLHRIITGWSDELVRDVKTCLEFIGFEQVRDVDEEIKNKAKKVPKQEDLQILDDSPALLIEIKGLSGLPKEIETNQVEKYISRRMKEWDRTDIRGVSIINHLRNVHGLERENENVFSKQQKEDAEDRDITILTTWDLFLLIRGMIKWKWNPKAIRELFYQKGRMPRVPAHYKPIGSITHYWEKLGVIEIKISNDNINKGQRIGYFINSVYLEEEIQSMQVDQQGVEVATQGQSVTIKTRYSKKELPKKATVYKVLNDSGS